MKPLISYWAGLVLAAVMATAVMAQTDEDPVTRGRALVDRLCADCHAIDRVGLSPDREAPPLHTLSRSFDLGEFLGELERGLYPTHPDMPAFKFDEQDARAIRSYLQAIQD